MRSRLKIRSNKVRAAFWLAVAVGPWLPIPHTLICEAPLSPAHSIYDQQEARQGAYSKDAESFVNLPLAQLLKAVPNLKGLEPAESQEALPGILQEVGENVKRFFQDFPNTACVEKISMGGLGETAPDITTIGVFGSGASGGEAWESHTQKFQYLALARQGTLGVGLDEYRTNAKGEPAELGGAPGGYFVTKGFVSMPLYFHPDYQADSTFRYLGRQSIDKQRAYVVAFAQRPERARFTGKIEIAKTSLLVLMQGIAWIDPRDYRILQMRTDLLPSKEDIGPKRETTEIQFQAVSFKESSQVLWLPREVSVTVEWKKITYRNRHRYSKFKLFAVGTEQHVQPPEDVSPDRENPNGRH
jgi:hypothetical protein